MSLRWWRGCWSRRSFGLAHGLQLFQSLLIQMVLLRDGLWPWSQLREIRRVVEEGDLLVALLQDVDGADELGLVEEDARAVEEEPDDSEVNDDGDVDGFAETCFGAFVVERVEQMDELMLFEFAVAAGPHLDGLSGRGGVGRCLEGGHGLMGLTGTQEESCTLMEGDSPV